MALTKVSYSMIEGEILNVLDYGAVGDGTTDDTNAIQAAINAAVTTGTSVYFPVGYYKVTATLKVGATIITNYSAFVNRSVPGTDTIFNANSSSANIAANDSLIPISLIGEAGSYIVASFTPGSLAPVIEYNLDANPGLTAGIISNINIISSSFFVNGKYDLGGSTSYATNNLIGLFVYRGSRIVEKVLFAGLGVGLLSVNSYWLTFENIVSQNCGQGFNFFQANATYANNLLCFYNNNGFIYDAQAASLTNISSEQTNNDLKVFAADGCTIGPGYLEDTRSAPASGQIAVALGYQESTTGSPYYNITHCNINNLVVLGLNFGSSGKWGYRLWSCAQSTFTGCRAYSTTVIADLFSESDLINCDFIISQYTWTSDFVSKNSWTPIMADSVGNVFTTTTAVGQYTRVGNIIHAQAHIVWSSIGSPSAGSPLVLLLPKLSSSTANLTAAASIGYMAGFPSANVICGIQNPPGNVVAFLNFYTPNAASTPTIINATAMSATGELTVSISYLV